MPIEANKMAKIKPFTSVKFADLTESVRNGFSPSSTGKIKSHVLTLSAITGSEFDQTATKVGFFEHLIPEEKIVSSQDFLVCRGNGNKKLVGKGCFPSAIMDHA